MLKSAVLSLLLELSEIKLEHGKLVRLLSTFMVILPDDIKGPLGVWCKKFGFLTSSPSTTLALALSDLEKTLLNKPQPQPTHPAIATPILSPTLTSIHSNPQSGPILSPTLTSIHSNPQSGPILSPTLTSIHSNPQSGPILSPTLTSIHSNPQSGPILSPTLTSIHSNPQSGPILTKVDDTTTVAMEPFSQAMEQFKHQKFTPLPDNLNSVHHQMHLQGTPTLYCRPRTAARKAKLQQLTMSISRQKRGTL